MAKLKIGIVSGILHPRYGGPPSVIRDHVKGLAPYADTKVIGVCDPGDDESLRQIYPGCDLFPSAFPRRWFRGKGLRHALIQEVSHMDLLHAHMIWDHTVLSTALASRKAGKPYVVTSHGSILNVCRWKPLYKISYRTLILQPLFRSCAFIHALNEEEARGCREFGVKCPIRVIPNGLSESEYLVVRDPALAYQAWPALVGRRVMLFMGRLSPLKGLDMLPEAWAQCMRDPALRDWLLVIAGPDYRGFNQKLERQIEELGLGNNIIMTGAVFGGLKNSLLAAADGFVLPSHTEGFSVALLEALAASLPCLFTTECHFRELHERGGGLEVQPDKNSVAIGLIELMQQSPEKLHKMGVAGNTLGRSKYSLEQVSQQLVAMYNEALK